LPEHIVRSYRSSITNRNLYRISVKISETDLFILADSNLSQQAFQSTLKYRAQIEEYIKIHPAFRSSLFPVDADSFAPAIIQDMIRAAKTAGVGPMASVAGAIAEYVGRDLLRYSRDVIVENGGDIYLNISEDVTIGLFAGTSPLSGRIALNVHSNESPVGICTSSGTVGHSLSFGSADAVCIKSKSTVLADAAATAVGNVIKGRKDMKKGLKTAMSIEGVLGVLIVTGDTMAAQGSMEIKSA
jgi:uncharacterized protein